MHTATKPTWRPYPPAAARSGCTICRGTGWELCSESGAARARPCSCRALKQRVTLRDQARIPAQYEHCSLDNYRPASLMQIRALSEARRWADGYPDPGKDLYFAGAPGVGKTHLAVGIVRHLVSRFYDDVLFLDFPAFTASLMSPRRAGVAASLGVQAALSQAMDAGVLVLDDFRMAHPEDDSIRAAGEILRARRSEERWTIYTGESVRPRELLRGAAPPASSRSQGILAALPAGTLYEILSHTRILSIDGDDFRGKTSSDSRLF